MNSRALELATKVMRRVRDSTFWGLPVGTLIKPGMKPLGRRHQGRHRASETPPQRSSTMYASSTAMPTLQWFDYDAKNQHYVYQGDVGTYYMKVRTDPNGNGNWFIPEIHLKGQDPIAIRLVTEDADTRKPRTIERRFSNVIDAIEANPDLVKALSRPKKPVNETWFDYSYGIRGLDWVDSPDEFEWYQDEYGDGVRRVINRDAADLGVSIDKSMPDDYAALANSLLHSYNDMYPGFPNLLAELKFEPIGISSMEMKAKRVQRTASSNARESTALAAEITVNSKKWREDDNSYLYEGMATRISHEIGWHPNQDFGEHKPEDWEDWEYSFMLSLNHEFGHIAGFATEDYPDLQAQLLSLMESIGVTRNIGTKERPLMEFDTGMASLLVSHYGSTNLHEFMADAWTEYVSHPRPRAFVVQVGDIMADAVTRHIKEKSAQELAPHVTYYAAPMTTREQTSMIRNGKVREWLDYQKTRLLMENDPLGASIFMRYADKLTDSPSKEELLSLAGKLDVDAWNGWMGRYRTSEVRAIIKALKKMAGG